MKYIIEYRFGRNDTYTSRTEYSKEDFAEEVEYLSEIGAVDIKVKVEE